MWDVSWIGLFLAWLAWIIWATKTAVAAIKSMKTRNQYATVPLGVPEIKRGHKVGDSSECRNMYRIKDF